MTRFLLGVGNRFSHDDGVGPFVAEALSVCGDWRTVDCATAVENSIGIVARERASLVVIVDAARMGLAPGAVRRLPTSFSDRMLASTHGLPLSFLIQQVQAAAGEIVLVGVEPGDLTPGEGLSPAVEAGAKQLIEELRCGGVTQIPAIDLATPGARAGRSTDKAGCMRVCPVDETTGSP